MPRPRFLLAALALPLAGCGVAAQTSARVTPGATSAVVARPAMTPRPAATVTSARAPAAAGAAASPVVARRLARITAIAERQYNRETGGAVVRADLHRIAADAGLRAAARSGSVATLRAYVRMRFPVWYHEHVSRLQIVRAGHTIVDAGVPFVVDGPHVGLPGGDSLRISIQDEIGFVRLLHRHHPVDVVVRGTSRGHVRSSFAAAPTAALPARGLVTIAGRRYDVRSFPRAAVGGEPVTVWVLVRD